MSYKTISRPASNGQPKLALQTTLADLLAMQTDKDRRSAIRTLARLIGRPLEMTPAEPKALRRIMEQIVPAQHGISQRRYGNIRSLVGRSLTAAGVLPPRPLGQLSASWLSLLNVLPPLQRIPLSTLAHWCSARSIEPEGVRQETFEAFHKHLESETLRARPRGVYLAACNAWNRHQASTAGWPPFRVSWVSLKNAYARPWGNFGPAFSDEVERMITAALAPDPLDATARHPIRKATAIDRRRQIKRLASALALQGRDPSTIRRIADLVEPDAARLILQFLLKRSSNRKTGDIHRSAALLCLLARDWVKAPKTVVQQLEQFRENLKPGPVTMTKKNRATLRPFDSDDVVQRFLDLPDNVFAKARRATSLGVKVALQMQLALAVEILTAAPVRVRNLASIRLGTNVVDVRAGRERRVHLHFAPEEIKNSIECEYVLPARTIALLDEYVRDALPILRRGDHDYLFPGEAQGHKQFALLSTQLADFTERELGCRLTAHQFRHLAGFIFLKKYPGSHEVVRRLLGHRSIQTTIQSYAGMEVGAAIALYDKHIAEQRSQSGSPSKRRSTKRGKRGKD